MTARSPRRAQRRTAAGCGTTPYRAQSCPDRPKPPQRLAPAQARRPAEPLSDAELEQLRGLLDALPQPLEPLDVSMLDGYLVGVLLQPSRCPSRPGRPMCWTPGPRSSARGHERAVQAGPAPPPRAEPGPSSTANGLTLGLRKAR